ncbi:hypothetical protein M758_11G051800 [Ceratodon purpureus]|nr:hypothetical protein M758_11G051800 [Ceratodon purpureus]
MAMVTETATRKRIFTMQHSERSPSWISSPFVPFTPFGLANGSEITPPFEKRLRTAPKSMSTFKWEPDLPGMMQFSPGNGYRKLEVKTPLPAGWRPFRGASQGLSTPPTVRDSRKNYERVKNEMKERDSWYAKLDYSTGLAENALDIVGRPAYGVKLTLGPTESYYQKYVNARRELDDYKRVVQAVNSSVPLVANDKHTLHSSLESMRRRGSNLQQGPRNLYNIQGVVKEHQRGGGHSFSVMENGGPSRSPLNEKAQPQEDVVPDTSLQPMVTSVAAHDQDEADAPKDDGKKESWQVLYERTKDPALKARMESQEKDIEALLEQYSRLQLQREEDEERRQKERAASKKEEESEAFAPLSIDAEEAIKDALYNGNRSELLVMNEETNIEVTRAIMQCLVPGAWLNDEVINVYMQLLKDRENRNPDKFLKCHFFNTFFYNKLYKDKRSYDYKSVRRWTTQKKIGYSLADCDKIMVPIHQDIHWCLAVINLRDQKFEYLDSLKGRDENVLKVLAKYLVDEAKDKNNRIIDVSKWESVFPQDIPEQLNGCDCGMFMVKYADFHSRGGPLSFTQAHMEYFRRRTVYEILQNEAT